MSRQFFRLRKKSIAFLPIGLLSLVVAVFIHACTFVNSDQITINSDQKDINSDPPKNSPVKVSGLSLDDYELIWDDVEGASYQVQKKKGTSASYANFGGTVKVQDTKASLTVDDAYAFYRVRSCTSRAGQADQDCSEYSDEVENAGPLSTICTAKRHEPNNRAKLVELINGEIEKQGNEANLSCIDTSAIIDMSELFKDKDQFNGDISKWDVSKVTNMESMFNGATTFNGDISKWDVSNVTDMREMFSGQDSANSAFNQDIGDWKVSKVTDMYSMFEWATAFNQDISRWDVSNVSTMVWMFLGASTFNQDLSAWTTKVTQVVDMFNMFEDSGMAGNEPPWYR